MSQALKSKYPSAIHVEWEQKGGYFVADCKVDGQEKDVWFNNQAEWKLTEMILLWNNFLLRCKPLSRAVNMLQLEIEGYCSS